jgi:hypothetical protein
VPPAISGSGYRNEWEDARRDVIANLCCDRWPPWSSSSDPLPFRAGLTSYIVFEHALVWLLFVPANHGHLGLLVGLRDNEAS